MKQIDVSDLPEDVARSLAEQAEHYRARAKQVRNGAQVKPLPQWPGTAVAPDELRREHLYDDED